jgi:hypothetical protein
VSMERAQKDYNDDDITLKAQEQKSNLKCLLFNTERALFRPALRNLKAMRKGWDRAESHSEHNSHAKSSDASVYRLHCAKLQRADCFVSHKVC